jgi:hypothetical protein
MRRASRHARSFIRQRDRGPGELLISKARLATLPTSGSPWTYLLDRADTGLTFINTTTATQDSPWLPNYDSSSPVQRIAPMTLAMALVYARIGGSSYANKVRDVCRFVIGTEVEASNNGNPSFNALLATCRQLSAFVLAADLTGMDKTVTGTRTGWTTTTWQDWLASLPTKTIGTSGQASNIAQLNNERAHNWGAWGSATRLTLALYLKNSTELAATLNNFKRWLGDTTVFGDWVNSADFDSSYVCLPVGGSNPVTDWVAVNPATCGTRKDGLLVEDIGRSAMSYAASGTYYDETGIGYTFEAYQAQLLAAILLDRQGYDPWSWSDQALKRVADWCQREAVFPTTTGGTWTDLHIAWIPRYFYGVNYDRIASKMGNTFGFTDWLYP